MSGQCGGAPDGRHHWQNVTTVSDQAERRQCVYCQAGETIKPKGHEILVEDDGYVVFRCYQDKPGHHTGSIHGVNEGDKVVTCPTCKARLKATWNVRLIETTDPETDE